MPKKHGHCDKYWKDLSDCAKEAAGVLQYTQESWDADEKVPFDTKAFTELTENEKKAAMFLGIEFIEKKNNIYWAEVDEVTQAHAQALGWDQHKWDHDWRIEHLECEKWYWADMTDEQIQAGKYFGYCQQTWDQTGEDISFDGSGNSAPPPAAKPSKKPSRTSTRPSKKPQSAPAKQQQQEEKKDDEEEQSEQSSKPKFKESRFYGGGSGASYDHGNNRWIKEIELYTSSIVNGMQVKYHGGRTVTNGADGPTPITGRRHTLTMQGDEFVNQIIVRAAGTIQELTFITNKGQKFGPHGGKGRMMKDKEGEVFTVKAPTGYHLSGFFGRESKLIDALAFRWAPDN